ncbi:MAG: hemolysin family protein [bacterium]
MTLYIQLAGIALLLALSALISGSETALFSLTAAGRDQLRQQQPRAGRRVDDLLASPARLLGAILVSNVAVNVTASALATLVLVEWSGRAGASPALYLGLGGLAMTGLLLVFGEVTPKLLAARDPVRFALVAAPVVGTVRALFAPVAALLDRIDARLAARRGEDEHLSESELHTMFRVGRERGVIVEREEEILWNLVGLADRTVGEVMTPRIEMVALEKSATVREAVALAAEHLLSRLPVYDGSVDRVVGVVYAKELPGADPDRPVAELMRRAYFVPEVKRLPSLLDELRKKGSHIAVVVDEFGQTAGLVTLEDVLEAIFGEIADEYDEPGELPWRRLADGSLEVDGEVDIATLDRLMRGRFAGVEQERLSGFVHERLGRLPARGDVVRFGGLEIEVSETSEHKLEKALIRRARRGQG